MQSPPTWHALVRSLLVVLLYTGAVVWTSLYPSAWTVVVVTLPLAAMLWSHACNCWKKPNASLFERLRGALYLASFVLALVLLKPFLLQNFMWIYLLQHSGIHLSLGWMFGRSLKAGAVPMCTQFAHLVHPAEIMTDAVLYYTRQVTLAWTCFFLFIGISSPIVLALCPLPVWTLFSTVITMGLTAAMFAVEAVTRRYVMPAGYRSGFVYTWRAIERHFREGHAS